MGFHPWNLQSTLITVQWICGVMCQDSEAYIAACQVQWYKSKDVLQHLKATLVYAKLPSPSEMLYNCKILTTIPSRIHNTDPAALQVQEHLEDWAEHAKSLADKCSKQLAPFYAGQPTATFDTLRKICIPATVVCFLPKKSNQVCTANGTIYCHTRCHLWECNVRCNDAEPKAPSATSEQAHIRFPRSVLQPVTTTEWTPQSVAPVTPEPSPAVPVSTPTAMPKVIPSAYTQLYTKWSTCATTKVRPYPHSTRRPNHRDVTKKVTALALQLMHLTWNANGAC